MGRDINVGLSITVPSFFRCPISLEVMKSPVSLTTGVTYDRASITRWLDQGNNTCPATMQLLPSKHLTPNTTLLRLIHIWADSLTLPKPTTGLSSSSDADDVIITTELMENMDWQRSENLKKIARFAASSEENRRFVSKCDGFVAVIVEKLHSGNSDVRVLEQTVRIVQLVLGELGHDLILKDCLYSLLLVLQQGSDESRVASLRVLEFIAGGGVESRLLIAEEDGMLLALLTLASPGKGSELTEAGLNCLIAVSVAKHVKVKLVQLGAVKSLSKLFSDSSSTTATIERVLKLLEMVSSIKEGRAKICEVEDNEGGECCVSGIVGKLLKVSTATTEHAVTILWSVCYLFNERSATEAVSKANGLAKILLLMQSNCSPCVRHMCTDLLKIFRVNSKLAISCYDTKTTHIMPF